HYRSDHHDGRSTRVAPSGNARSPLERSKGSHRSVDGGGRSRGGQDIRRSQGGHGSGSEWALEDRARDAHRVAQEARHFRRCSSSTATIGESLKESNMDVNQGG